MRLILESSLERPVVQKSCLDAIGSTCAAAGPSEAILREARQAVFHLLAADTNPPAAAHAWPIVGEDISTPMCGHLLHMWAQGAQDPAAIAATWTWRGAPGGICTDYAELEGLLPQTRSDDVTADAYHLHTEHASLRNYGGVEANEDVAASVEGFKK